MNSYELMRPFWDWAYDNPEKIKPVHSAIFHFAIEHCNRMGWKQKFGFPSQMTMEAIGVKSYRTYSNALIDLVDWGFIKMVEKSKNQYSANIIELISKAKANTKALDKALPKHGLKQGQSTGESIDSIIKQLNKEQFNLKQLNMVHFHLEEIFSNEKPETPDLFESEKITFDKFWDLYDKKTDKPKCLKIWEKLSSEIRTSIMNHIPKYKISQPEKQYRKNPLTYLNGECWNDEIIDNNGETKNNTGNLRGNHAASTSHRTDQTDYSGYSG